MITKKGCLRLNDSRFFELDEQDVMTALEIVPVTIDEDLFDGAVLELGLGSPDSKFTHHIFLSKDDIKELIAYLDQYKDWNPPLKDGGNIVTKELK